MAQLDGLLKYSGTIVLAIFCISVSLARGNDLSLPSEVHAQTLSQENEPARLISRGLTSEYFTTYSNIIRMMITSPEHPAQPVGSMDESFADTAAITLNKDKGKIIWSLSPSYGRLTLDQKNDTNKHQVVLKYRF